MYVRVGARGQRQLKKATRRICHSVHTPRHRHPPRLSSDSKSLSTTVALSRLSQPETGTAGRSLPRFPPFLTCSWRLVTTPAGSRSPSLSSGWPRATRLASARPPFGSSISMLENHSTDSAKRLSFFHWEFIQFYSQKKQAILQKYIHKIQWKSQFKL